MEAKEMCYKIPEGSCPNCGHRQFVVFESNESIYLTNTDGEIIDSSDIINCAIGKCIKCGSEYEMISTLTKFIPVTPLRSILFNYSPHKIKKENIINISNPMESDNNGRQV